jgi:hypothetical protein
VISGAVADIHAFRPVFLNEMQGSELQNRMDFKFVFHCSKLESILAAMKEHYKVLEINGVRIQHYETLYFDTPEHALYMAHHNQRGNRMKIRIRHYSSNQLCFAEVKSKLNTGRTVKKRYPLENMQQPLPANVLSGITATCGVEYGQLRPGVLINFDRITFVALNGTERLTLDLNLEMREGDHSRLLPELVIAELKLYKKEKSVFSEIMQDLRIRPWGVSKYCLAVSLLNQSVRRNNFKPIHNYLQKIQNNSLNGTRPV